MSIGGDTFLFDLTVVPIVDTVSILLYFCGGCKAGGDVVIKSITDPLLLICNDGNVFVVLVEVVNLSKFLGVLSPINLGNCLLFN